MTYYKLAKLRWGEISCTLGNFKATFSVHIWVIRNVQLSCSVTRQRKAQSFWAVRWATLPLRHTCLFSKSKWNTSWNVSLQPWCSQFPTRREKMYSPQEVQLSLPSKSPGSAFNHTQNQGRPQRKAAEKTPFHWLSNFICPEYFPSVISLYLICSYDVWQGKYVYLSLQMRKDRSHL